MADADYIPPLLRLPRELRDEISTYFLAEYVSPPPNPSYPGPRTITHTIRYPLTYTHWRHPPLTGLNRQIRNEYFGLVAERIRAGHVEAELDIMYKGYLSWPTWTLLPPFLAPGVEFDLTVQLRVFSGEGFRSNDGWPRQPGKAFRDLFELLKDLVRKGPGFGVDGKECPLSPDLSHSPDPRGLYRINNLRVNVSFQDVYTPATHAETVETIFAMLKELARSGLARDVIETICAHAEFAENGERKVLEEKWVVREVVDRRRVGTWINYGFILVGQTHLAGDRWKD